MTRPEVAMQMTRLQSVIAMFKADLPWQHQLKILPGKQQVFLGEVSHPVKVSASSYPTSTPQVKHKKPKVKPAAQPPLEALQPFELRRQQQQQQVQPEPAQQEVRHVPPPPRPPPQPEPPQPPAAFDSKPAPWAHKRPAAVPGMLLPPVTSHCTKSPA